ncbi:MAG TPA: YhjD/YihY/BrkB family envelope integrity protein [Polyangiaceae bacterium]
MGAPRDRSGFGRTVQFVKAFAREVTETRTTGMAAEMAFWVFLSLLPLAAVAGLVVARIAVGSNEVASLLSSLPPQMNQLIHHQLTRVAAWNGGSVGAPAAAVFVWLGSGGVSAIFELLEVKAGMRRSWWRRRLVAIATCVGLSLGVAAIAVLFTGASRILSLLHGILPLATFEAKHGWFDKVFRFGIGVVVGVGLVGGVYWAAVPRRARIHFPIWPGAFLAVGLQAVLGYGYAFYLSKMGAGSAYQAGLSFVGVTLMGLYLFAIALLVGAELNHALFAVDHPDDEAVLLRASRRAPRDEAIDSTRLRDGVLNPSPLSFEAVERERAARQPSPRIPP